MTLSKEEQQSVSDYSDKFNTWVATIMRSLRNGREDLDSIMKEDGLSFNTKIDKMVTAWDVSINFIRTEIKSGRSQARRMALNRGVDHRNFHPAQIKTKAMSKEVAQALEDK